MTSRTWRTHRRAAWDGYVGATRNVVDAAGDAQVVLISTDWVFDGTQAGATEDEPPNPINVYGFLKAASELVVTERAKHGAVARISGVQGAASGPRAQDHGFGYFVASLVQALRAGEPFTVWEAEDINMRATPTLASDVGDLIWRMLERERTGIHHCCGGESVTRSELARATVTAFDLDGELLRFGPPPPPSGPVPYDTSIDGTRDRHRARGRAAGRRRPAHASAGAAPVMKLTAGDLEATFAPEAGMVCHSLRHRGEELLGQRGGLEAYAKTGKTMGIPLLHPWANRLGAWSYDALGVHVDLHGKPLRVDAGTGLPMHGTIPRPWRVLEPGVAELDGASDAFPFAHTVRLQASLEGDTLRITTTIEAHDGPVPVSFGFHPFLLIPGVPRAEWHVELPVTRRIGLTDQQLPSGETEPVEPYIGPLGDRAYDDGYDERDDRPFVVAAAAAASRCASRRASPSPRSSPRPPTT